MFHIRWHGARRMLVACVLAALPLLVATSLPQPLVSAAQDAKPDAFSQIKVPAEANKPEVFVQILSVAPDSVTKPFNPDAIQPDFSDEGIATLQHYTQTIQQMVDKSETFRDIVRAGCQRQQTNCVTVVLARNQTAFSMASALVNSNVVIIDPGKMEWVMNYGMTVAPGPGTTPEQAQAALQQAKDTFEFKIIGHEFKHVTGAVDPKGQAAYTEAGEPAKAEGLVLKDMGFTEERQKYVSRTRLQGCPDPVSCSIYTVTKDGHTANVYVIPNLYPQPNMPSFTFESHYLDPSATAALDALPESGFLGLGDPLDLNDDGEHVECEACDHAELDAPGQGPVLIGLAPITAFGQAVAPQLVTRNANTIFIGTPYSVVAANGRVDPNWVGLASATSMTTGGDWPTFYTPHVPWTATVTPSLNADAFSSGRPQRTNQDMAGYVTATQLMQLGASPPVHDPAPVRAALGDLVRALFPVLEAAQASPRATPPAFTVLARSNGQSSGEAFEITIIREGTTAPVLFPAGLIVLEPLRPSDASNLTRELARYRDRVQTTVTAEGFCLDKAKDPPVVGQYYRVAPAAEQTRRRPVDTILRVAERLRGLGALHPDSAAASYFTSIRQWAIWAREERYDERRFGDALVDYTRKALEGNGTRWTGELERTLRGLVPNRWRDIQLVLREADHESRVMARRR